MRGCHRALTSAALRGMLKDAGCRFVRVSRGTHEIWETAEGRRLPPVPSGGRSDYVSTDIALPVLRAAGLLAAGTGISRLSRRL